MNSKKRKQTPNFDSITNKIKSYKQYQNNLVSKNKELIEHNNNIIIINNSQPIQFTTFVNEFSNILINNSNFKNKTKLNEILKFITNYTITKFEIDKLEKELNTYPTEITQPLYNAVDKYNSHFNNDNDNYESNIQYRNKKNLRNNNNNDNDDDNNDDDNDDDNDENYTNQDL